MAILYFISLGYQRWKKIRDFHVMEETRAHTHELADIGMNSLHGRNNIEANSDPERDTKGDGLI